MWITQKRQAARCIRHFAGLFIFAPNWPIRSPEDVGLGKLDEFAAAPAKHRLKHKQAETVCLLEGGLGRHRQFLRVRDYIEQRGTLDRKSTRLNSSHTVI